MKEKIVIFRLSLMMVHSPSRTFQSTTFQKNRVKQPYSSVYGMETIPDVPDHAEAIAVETRDDQSVPTLMDEDLIVPHPFGQSLDPEHEVREEAIEIINISFLHE